MEMTTIIKISQAVIAILLILSVLLQNKGSGLSSIFGGGGAVYQTKRGLEKKLFISTIVLSALFFMVSFAIIIIR